MIKRHWRSVLGVALVFGLGLLSGAAVATYVHFRFLARPDLPDKMGAIALRHLTRELDLTETQQQVVRETMEESRRELRALRQKMGPQMDATFQKTRDKIRAVLNEEQRKQLDEMAERRGAVMGRFFGRPRFGPPGPGRRMKGRHPRGDWGDGPPRPPLDGEPMPELPVPPGTSGTSEAPPAPSPEASPSLP